jgi:hypothetical protein
MNMKRIAFWVIALFLMLFATAPAQAAEVLVLYDDFETVKIEPDKWFGSESSLGARETIRGVANGQLRIMERLYGYTGTNSGGVPGTQRLYFMYPDTIKTIKATVKVAKFETIGCDANSSYYSYAAAYLQGYFFNTASTAPPPGNSTNDVMARIGIRARTNTHVQPEELQVVGIVSHCTDSQCNSATTIDLKDLGPIAVGQKVTLYMKWEKSNHRFVFRRDTAAKVYSAYDVKLYPDKSPPGYNGKRLRVEAGAANCSDSPRPVASMDAYFDNVYINQ